MPLLLGCLVLNSPKGRLVKEELAKAIFAELEPIQERRREIEAKKGYVEEVLENGASRARIIAQKTVAEVREKMGLK